MTLKAIIEKKLQDAFAPSHLQVIDESHLHAGHAGNPTGAGETHFRVYMTSSQFLGKRRLEQHRAVNAVLADELKHSIHALALELDAS